ncbi:MAG: sulfite exporter TauE/SafE family protein [Pseudomonadota bacterium]
MTLFADPSALLWALVLLSGFFAGYINTLAGGGSFLTLPALMLAGLPPDAANATNRINVLVESVSAVRSFGKRRLLPVAAFKQTLAVTVLGTAIGAGLATVIPNQWLGPILLTTMLTLLAGLMLFPDRLMPHHHDGEQARVTGPSLWALLGATIYGGFIQAGVGFLLVACFTSLMHFDLVRANALKLGLGLVFAVVPIAIFMGAGDIRWTYGLIQAAAAWCGVQLAIHTAVRVSPQFLRRFLTVCVLVMCGLLILRQWW